MAIKTTIQNLIISLIRSNPSLIDKDEHADVEDALLNALYGTKVYEDYTTTNTITSDNNVEGLEYFVDICKQGRFVYISGNINNPTDAIIDVSDVDKWFFEIVLPEYQTTHSAFCLGSSGENIRITNNKIYTTIGANSGCNFTMIYLTTN